MHSRTVHFVDKEMITKAGKTSYMHTFRTRTINVEYIKINTSGNKRQFVQGKPVTIMPSRDDHKHYAKRLSDSPHVHHTRTHTHTKNIHTLNRLSVIIQWTKSRQPEEWAPCVCYAKL